MSLYAGLLTLSRSDIQALRVTDPYSIHRTVYGLYEDVRDESAKANGDASGILFADLGATPSGRKILMLANRQPAASAEGGRGRVDYRPVPKSFLEHAHYQFEIIVNPVKRDSSTKQILPIRGREAIAAWFVGKAPERWGFKASAEHIQIGKVDVLQFKDKEQRPVTLAQAHISGRFSVTDGEQFSKSFASGIGKGRSFGCGLLRIAPIT